MRKGEPSLVVKSYQPARFWLTTVLLLAAITVAGWIVFDFGRQQGNLDGVEYSVERKKLKKKIDNLNQELQSFKAQVGQLQSAAMVDQQAQNQTKDNLRRLQEDNLELREELQFYRNIVVPSQDKTGIRVQDIVLEPGAEANRFRYRLTLIQVHGIKARHRQIRGRVEIVLEGQQGDAVRHMSLKELTSSKKSSIKFSIKYFKRIDGDLILPEGFQPRNIMVKVVPKVKGASNIEKKFKWSVSTG